MPGIRRQYKDYEPASRAQWREWLETNGETSDGVWLIFAKKHANKSTLVYADAVEEALCFGWIDSVANKLDNTRYKQLFTPRKPKSVWSKINKQRVKKLIQQGLMTPAGLATVKIAKANGSWSKLDSIEKLSVPPDLQKAFAANKTARNYFENFAPSYKKGILQWIDSAKTPATRAQRIVTTVSMAAENRKAFFDKWLNRRQASSKKR